MWDMCVAEVGVAGRKGGGGIPLGDRWGVLETDDEDEEEGLPLLMDGDTEDEEEKKSEKKRKREEVLIYSTC